ncbi:hypothetical protein [Chelativorans sp. Marseille-P2723]|uniref:hypothetical protein n=1 Tax=Chelativorans sp. Marseille-P2723 TaxID=2709133 RepID=UPI00157139CE|nr:hypothetical protein [Chelativorans sp. Marseille-P2723]
MNDKRKKEAPEDLSEEAPKRAEPDWDAIKGVQYTPEDEEGDSVPLDQSGKVSTDEHYGEGEDNPYMESDEALPDDEEEKVFRRNNAREGGRFNEV